MVPGASALPTPECLIALDLLCWLGSGREVADRLQCNPSTVSRKSEACALSLGLFLRKRHALWNLYGQTELLQAERELHQRYRLAGYLPLRLDVSADAAGLLGVESGLRPWETGGQGHLSVGRPLELLQQRVTDAWLCSFCDELPANLDADWCVFDLCRLPLLLLAHVAHPLVARGNGITRGNGKQRLPEPAGELLPPGSLTDFPSVSLPVHCQPKRFAALQRHGLGGTTVALQRHDPLKWDGLLDDALSLRPGTELDLLQHPDWRALPFGLDHQARIGLVFHRDLSGHAVTCHLVDRLERWRDGLATAVVTASC